MEGSLYDNLLKATNNVDDITTEKYGVITKLYGLYCNVKESGTGLEHSNVPIVNGANLSVGDKVIIGFINNSIYNVVVYGSLDKQVHDNTKQDQLISGTNIKTINSESILGSGNLVIQGGSSVDIVTEWETTLSDSKVASEKLTKDSLDGKADSSHTHTVSNITDFPSIPSDVSDLTDNNDVIPTKISDLTNDSDFIEKSNTTGLVKNDGTIDTTSYSTFSGSYNDLSNKPSIPSSSSDLSDGSNIVKKSSTSGLLKNDGTVDTTSYSTFSGSYNDLSGKPTIPTKTSDLTNDGDGTNAFLTQHQSLVNYVQKSSISGLLKNDGSVDTTQYLSSLPSHNHDDRYYTESEVDTALNGKQATLISGTNIKTINNTSLLGSGNISIQGGGTVTVDDSLSTTSTNPVQNKVITGALNGKANSSHTHISSDVTDLIDMVYPVGSIYMSANDVDPSTLFGGTWQRIEDKFLLSKGSTYNTLGGTGGSANAVIVKHTHTQNQHRHELTGSKTTGMSTGNYLRAGYGSATDGQYTNYSTPTINSEGVDGTGKNMPPYLIINVWKRTA